MVTFQGSPLCLPENIISSETIFVMGSCSILSIYYISLWVYSKHHLKLSIFLDLEIGSHLNIQTIIWAIIRIQFLERKILHWKVTSVVTSSPAQHLPVIGSGWADGPSTDFGNEHSSVHVSRSISFNIKLYPRKRPKSPKTCFFWEILLDILCGLQDHS